MPRERSGEFRYRKIEGRAVLDREANPIAVYDLGLKHIHRRLADKRGDIQIGWPFAQILLTGELLQHAAFHDRDAVGERIGLGLVVCDKDRGHAAIDQKALQPASQDGAQPWLELTHGFVQEIEIGLAHERARETCALLLSARNRTWISIEDPLDLQDVRDFRHRSLHILCGHARAFQRERDIVADSERADRANSLRTPSRLFDAMEASD